jgi:hypothetical protein
MKINQKFKIAAIAVVLSASSAAHASWQQWTGWCASIQSYPNRQYVSTELNYGYGCYDSSSCANNYGLLRARAGSIGSWEVYRLWYNDVGGNQAQWAFQSAANGLFVSAEYGYPNALSSELRARASTIGPWETFRFAYDTNYGSDWIFIRSQDGTHNNYVSAEMGYTGPSYAMLRARKTGLGPSDLLGDWERFGVFIFGC